MKTFKKVGAVFLALIMTVALVPQVGKEVKAATVSTNVFNLKQQDSYFTADMTLLNDNTNTSAKTKDFTGGGYKLNSALDTPITFTVASGRYAVVEFNLNKRYDNKESSMEVKNSADEVLGAELMEAYPDLVMKPSSVYNSAANSEHFMLPVVCEAGDYKIQRNGTGECVLYQITVTEYDSKDDADAIVSAYVKSITDKKKYTVSGTITSEIDLTGGSVTLTTATSGAKNVESEPITKNGDGTFSYTVNDVIGDGAVYSVQVKSRAISEVKKNVDSAELAKFSFTVDNAAVDNANFTIKYKEITNIWDFTDLSDWAAVSMQNEEGVYKGLEIDAKNGKFATSVGSDGTGRIQVNAGTKVKIPVSGWGTVTCTFTKGSKVPIATTLGSAKGDGKSATITTTYENAKYVELSVAETGHWLQKIEVVPDSAQPIKTIGASVRQETAEWGNGIRFGSQLDLTKVNKENSVSGTLIGLANTVAGKELTLDDANIICVNVVRSTFIKETENVSLEYAAALIKIPEEEKDTEIVARPYVTIDGNTYYGEQVVTTYNLATKAVAAANAQ